MLFAQAIATYAIGCFDITKMLCDQISTMICWYWWNQQEGEHNNHWLSWEIMIKPKKEGGFGFRESMFNMAMMCKQAWRLLQNPNSLCAKLLQAKYYNGRSCLDAQPSRGMSYSWRSILQGVCHTLGV